MFWADINQARDRLSGSVVGYNGVPFAVNEVSINDAGNPVAIGNFVNNRALGEVLNLDDDAWHNFREVTCPSFINTVTGLMLVVRSPIRAVKHGLTNQNCSVYTFHQGKWMAAPVNFHNLLHNYAEEFVSAWKREYPTFDQVRDIVLAGSALAFSPSYFIYSNPAGPLEIWRDQKPIGFFVGNNVYLSPKTVCYREELQEKHLIPNIMEA